MAQKKITDLQLRGAVDGSLSIPSDDTIQTYRVTVDQIKAYILAAGNVVTATLADLSVNTIKLAAGAVTDPKTNFTKPTTAYLTAASGNLPIPAGVKWCEIEWAAPGGGGGGAGPGSTAGTAAGNVVFGVSLITALGGGGGGAAGGNGGSAGTNTINSPAITLRDQPGGNGSGGIGVNSSTNVGGMSMFGGGGAGRSGLDGLNGVGDSGGGGAGGTSPSTSSGGSGGAGGSGRAQLNDPLSVYPTSTYPLGIPYAVGSRGISGGNGTSSGNGGYGAFGFIRVRWYYN